MGNNHGVISAQSRARQTDCIAKIQKISVTVSSNTFHKNEPTLIESSLSKLIFLLKTHWYLLSPNPQHIRHQ